MQKPLTFITSHALKAEQLSLHLHYPVVHKKLDIPEIQSLDPIAVVTHKAKTAYEFVKTPVLVEDTSIRFEALGKLPGTLIKWFLVELKPGGLCKIIQGYKDKAALVEPYFALYNGKQVEIFSASLEGTIADFPRGNNGFGTDAIFIPKGYTKTWGEMTKEEQIETSVRKIALKKLETYLTTRSKYMS